MLAGRFMSPFRVDQNPNRLYIWRATFRMIKDHLWFGVGAGVFIHVYPKYVLPETPEPVLAFAHNLFWGRRSARETQMVRSANLTAWRAKA